MEEFVEYWGNPVNIFEDIRSLSRNNDCKSVAHPMKTFKRTLPGNAYTVRNSVCIAGNDRDSLMAVKRQVHRMISGKCAVESFHFTSGDDVRDGALLVPKVILVAIFQPGRKLIDDSGDEGQLDQAYDEIFKIGAELMVVYVDLPRMVYPTNANNLYHARLEQLVFPAQTLVKNLALHNLLLTLTESSRKFNSAQEQRMLEWLLKPVDPTTHPVYRACALVNDLLRRRQEADSRRQKRWQLKKELATDPNYQSEPAFWSKDNPCFTNEDNEDEVFYNPHATNLPESYRTMKQNWNANPVHPYGLEPNIYYRRPPSLSESSDDDGAGEEQLMVHGFMKSMESYPLLQRSSRSRKKKSGINSFKKFKKSHSYPKDDNSSGREKPGGRSGGYGSLDVADNGADLEEDGECMRASR